MRSFPGACQRRIVGRVPWSATTLNSKLEENE